MHASPEMPKAGLVLEVRPVSRQQTPIATPSRKQSLPRLPDSAIGKLNAVSAFQNRSGPLTLEPIQESFFQ